MLYAIVCHIIKILYEDEAPQQNGVVFFVI